MDTIGIESCVIRTFRSLEQPSAYFSSRDRVSCFARCMLHVVEQKIFFQACFLKQEDMLSMGSTCVFVNPTSFLALEVLSLFQATAVGEVDDLGVDFQCCSTHRRDRTSTNACIVADQTGVSRQEELCARASGIWCPICKGRL